MSTLLKVYLVLHFCASDSLKWPQSAVLDSAVLSSVPESKKAMTQLAGKVFVR